MIRPYILLGIARAEMRLTRRLVRFWIFQSLAFLLGALGFAYYAVLHWQISGVTASAAMLNPRYLLAFLGIYYIVMFLLGLIFLGFDVRARDTRERMVEVLDALPCSNLELLLGRYLGILVTGWIPLLGTCALLMIAGRLVGSPLQPHSVGSFALVMALPAYTFTIGLVFFLALLLRHRGLVAIVALALLGGLIAANFAFVPIYMLPLADVTGGFTLPSPTDFVPALVDAPSALQRLAYLLAGLGLIWLAAAVHPRRDDASRAARAVTGSVLLLVALSTVAGLAYAGKGQIEQRKRWAERHAARADEPIPDLLAMRGVVRIDAGKRLSMDLELEIRARGDESLDSALFSLNPGLRVERATRDGQPVDARQEDGFLDVALPGGLGGEATTTLGLHIEGAPDRRFTFIEAAFDPLGLSIRDGNTFLLGYAPFVFDRRHVALLPGARWLPATGPEIGRSDPVKRAEDFYDVDLTVDVPAGWLAAGPGRRQIVQGAPEGRALQRFAPPAPVPDVALVAGRYEARSVEVDGVTLEVLLHPKHVKNLEVVAPAADEVREWLSGRLRDAAAVGLPYPYDGLSLIEVPGSLRGYGGGWRMGSTFIQPGLVFMRETGFPTARFDVRFDDPADFQDREGGMPRAIREDLERFFETDFAGGNPFVAAAQSFFGFQTAGAGPDALPLNFVFEDLSARLVTDKRGYFSVHQYGADIGQLMNRIMPAIFGNEGGDLAEVIIGAITSRTEVWDQVLGVSLQDLDPWKDPKVALDVLTLKGGAMADSMLDQLGREKTGRLLGELRERHGGTEFSREDVVEAGRVIEEDLATWLDVWVDRTELPGFVLGPVDLVRIADDDNGSPRYQLSVVLRNDENTPGLARLEYRTGDPDASGPRQKTEPVYVAARSSVEIGLVTSEPPYRALISPYLSLNREPFTVLLPALAEERIADRIAFSGTRATDWQPAATGTIVVDDLDPGFSIDEAGATSFLRFGGANAKEETDQGLPVHPGFQPPSRWARLERADAFGRYRHTAAVVRGGKGQRRASFVAELPEAGSWTLACHLPERYLRQGQGDGRGGRARLGGFKLKLVHAAGSRDLEFNAGGGEAGWNDLGEFDLDAGEVRLELSDDTDGRLVVADAIRWTPMGRRAAEGNAAR